MTNKKKLINKVSIIVTTKNSEKYLSGCLNSIGNQSFKNIELIIVDNHSNDNTVKIAKKYTKHIYIKGPERSAQRNYGAKKASSNYLYFVDSDFVLEKNVVFQAMNKINEGYDAIVVHNSPDVSVSWIAKVRKFEVDMYKFNLDHSAARFFKKDVFKKIGGYSENITAGEDYDIQNKLNRGSYKTGFIDAEAIHLGEPSSIIKHMKKYYDYGKDFNKYRRANKKESKKQLGFFRPVYFKNWKKFVKNPILGISFIFYHVLKFFSGGLGMLVGRYK